MGSHLAPKISPKINISRPWSTRNPQEPAREPGDHQKAPKMEFKVSLGPPKSDLCAPQGLQNGAPDTPKTSPKPFKIASQNATEINPNFIQKANKKHQKSSRMGQHWKHKWIQHGTQLEPNFAAQIWPNIWKKKCDNEANPKEGGRRCVAVRRLQYMPR